MIEQSAKEMGFIKRKLHSFKYDLIWLKRKYIPQILWYGDELDVSITLSSDKLNQNKDPMKQLYGGGFAEIEKIFIEMGITFDKGLGLDGRDWEWDWSLKGPISIRLRGKARNPEKRLERPKPKLVVCNN